MLNIIRKGDNVKSVFKIISAIVTGAFMLVMSVPDVSCGADEYTESYVLMEVSTGTVVRQRDSGKQMHSGSFNKLMTVLLAAEAAERGEITFDTVITASERAFSMTGAKIWLETGDKLTLGEMLKGIIIGNANDAACAVAEHIGGTEEKFAEMMNKRAAELGMASTVFTNASGSYDCEKQLTTAYDAALLLCELAGHEELREMFTTRVDEIKNGEVQLVTTNRMCHSYKGSVGFKCGRGEISGYFAAEGAVRDGAAYVTAVLDCADEDRAMALAKELLDIGFNGYSVIPLNVPEDMPETIAVKQGQLPEVRLTVQDTGVAVAAKGSEGNVRAEIYLPSFVYAPVEKGEKIGELRLYIGDRLIKCCIISAASEVCEKDFKNVLLEMMKYAVSF